MTTRVKHPTAQAILGWMQANPGNLRRLLDEVATGGGDLSPAGDPSILAHLAFVAEAVGATASPTRREPLEEFGRTAAAWLVAHAADVDAAIREVGEAHALEAMLQFGPAAGDDPTNRKVIDRRVRIIGWTNVFLTGLETATGNAGLAMRAREWMADHQTELAETIFSMDRRAKEAERARGGEDAIADAGVVNRIGQAAVVQGNVRFVVAAIAYTLDTTAQGA
ncbi:MAG: hypothetical protein EXQ74_06055 [Thermoleophilia bacterium]|nr:hypothetical protein [Thermoleophilia bacterium]